MGQHTFLCGDNRDNDTAIFQLVTAVLLKIEVFWDVTLPG